MGRVTVQRIVEELGEQLQLEELVPLPADPVEIYAADVHRPGMAIMGFAEGFLERRIQIMGETEMAYLATLDAQQQQTAIERVFSLLTPVIFVAKQLPVPEPVISLANERQFPLVRSALSAVDLIVELSSYLARRFAPLIEVHGTLVDVYGVGLLFTGRSGIGKSECALDLIERGHRLVADDVVKIRKTTDGVLLGSFREVLRHNLEIRGVGVIDVQAIFGIRAIRAQKRVEVEVQLQEWDDDQDYERMGLEPVYTTILGSQLPKVVVPLFPGKNITVIAEVIALDFMLKTYGYDAAEVLNKQIIKSIESGARLRRYLAQDRE